MRAVLATPDAAPEIGFRFWVHPGGPLSLPIRADTSLLYIQQV